MICKNKNRLESKKDTYKSYDDLSYPDFDESNKDTDLNVAERSNTTDGGNVNAAFEENPVEFDCIDDDIVVKYKQNNVESAVPELQRYYQNSNCRNTNMHTSYDQCRNSKRNFHDNHLRSHGYHGNKLTLHNNKGDKMSQGELGLVCGREDRRLEIWESLCR